MKTYVAPKLESFDEEEFLTDPVLAHCSDCYDPCPDDD